MRFFKAAKDFLFAYAFVKRTPLYPYVYLTHTKHFLCVIYVIERAPLISGFSASYRARSIYRGFATHS